MIEIQATISPYTTLFEDRSPLEFLQWCKKHDGQRRMSMFLNWLLLRMRINCKKNIFTQDLLYSRWCSPIDQFKHFKILTRRAKIYVSPRVHGQFKKFVRSRNINSTSDISKITQDIIGITQALYTSNVSRVIIDYTGLTTIINDFNQFLL
ncbi:hypothetical protein BDA99DRAFT_544455 [Phascolomyces articulosus]|uniref:Uncharacterized protein n=1 Tax=Phascolomyces articulosus TaxID=60185 RepID=A0AAD5P8B9_9FUNG|nr:hypothetical protein BDA99DRAFT_544455 [Phascolomyces articulosus]